MLSEGKGSILFAIVNFVHDNSYYIVSYNAIFKKTIS